MDENRQHEMETCRICGVRTSQSLLVNSETVTLGLLAYAHNSALQGWPLGIYWIW